MYDPQNYAVKYVGGDPMIGRWSMIPVEKNIYAVIVSRDLIVPTHEGVSRRFRLDSVYSSSKGPVSFIFCYTPPVEYSKESLPRVGG